MKKWHWLAIGATVLVLVVVGSISSSGPKGEKVYVEAVAKKDIESIVSASGQIDPKVKVNISAHVIGKVDRLYFKEGDYVRRGQRLVDLERVNFVAQRERMRSEMANRRIEVSRARVNLANAELQFKRAQRLREQGIQAEELYDRTRVELENARANQASTEEGVRQSAAGLKQADEDLSRTTMLSPIDGKVVELHAQEGEVVVTGTMNNPGSVIAVIADLSSVLVEAEVGETEIVKVRPGQITKVRVDAVVDKEYSGVVAEIGSSAATKQSGSGIRFFKVKITLDQPDENLRPGMTAQVEIVTQSLKGVVAVPVQSVVERNEDSLQRRPSKKKDEDLGDKDDEESKKKYVFLAKDGKVEAVEVATGISDATHVAITKGLGGGEQIITGPFRTLKRLKVGDTVQPQKESAAKDEKDEDKKDSDDEKEEKADE